MRKRMSIECEDQIEIRIVHSLPRNIRQDRKSTARPTYTRRRQIKCPIHFIWSARMAPSARWRRVFRPKRARSEERGERRRGGFRTENAAVPDRTEDLARSESAADWIVFRGTHLQSRWYFCLEHASEKPELDYAEKDSHITISSVSTRIIRKFLRNATSNRSGRATSPYRKTNKKIAIT